MIKVSVSPERVLAGEPSDLDIRLTNTGSAPCTSIVFSVRLPAGLLRLSGRPKIEVGRLDPGQSAPMPLRILADNAGHYELTSVNFSYRDHRGQSHRESGVAAAITVGPPRGPQAPPELTVDLQTVEVPYEEWADLRARIDNSGPVSVSNLVVTLSGPLTVDQTGGEVRLGGLPSGESADAAFYVYARQPGAHVPVHLDLAYREHGRDYHSTTTRSIKVSRGGAPAPRPSPVRILFLSANPLDTHRLRLDEEMREIQSTIRAGRERDHLEFRSLTAVRPRDISQALLDVVPQIVHFAGHGGGLGGSFAAEDPGGSAHLIPVDGLVQIFRTAGRSVQSVIVNACDTDLLARALAEVVPFVIGMRELVGDRSAIHFSTGFYQALAAGLPVDDAFDLGRGQLLMMTMGSDRRAPVLFRREGG